MGSADWMPRNLYERVEVLVPLRDEMLRERVRHEILDAYLADNRKARILLKDATYIRAWQPVHGSQESSAAHWRGGFQRARFLDGRGGREVARRVLPAPVSAQKA